MTLRWGIVATGRISHDFVNAFSSYPGEKGDQIIAAVAASDKTRASAFAKKFNIPRVFDSYQAMAQSYDIDIAYIGALNPDHYALTKLFLEQDKHVLCEKPLCLNGKQVKSLVDIARRRKLFLMEAVWSRFAPSYFALEKEIAAGKLGDVLFVEANFGVQLASVDRLNKKDLGGSSLLDLGIYSLQLAQYVFKDEPTKVIATGELNSEGVDCDETVILEYKGGRRAVLNISSKIKMWNKGSIYGTKGQITLSEPFHFPTEMINSSGCTEKFPLHESQHPYNFGNESAGLVYEAIEVNRCIKAGLIESPRMAHAESLIIAKLEDTIRKQLGVHFPVDDQEFP